MLCLAAFNLRPHQLCWTIKIDEMLAGKKGKASWRAIQTYFFLLYTMKPLLANHGLLHEDPSANLASGLKQLETSAHADKSMKSSARCTLLDIKVYEKAITRFGSYSRSPATAYAQYVDQIFSKYDAFFNLNFKHLHKRSGWPNYRDSQECQ